MSRLRQQLHDNLVAIISLIVALSTLTYTAWRQEVTEDNRTLREAAFAMLHTAEELQAVVDFSHYDGDIEAGNPIKGWGKVLYLQDLSVVMPPAIVAHTQQLKAVWDNDWAALGKHEAAAQRITRANTALREAVRSELAALP